MAVLRALLSEAESHERGGRWSEAARCYAQLADVLEGPSCVQALLSAGDCLRRADRPAPAARCLQAAYEQAEEDRRALIGLQLAGLLHAIGELPIARDLARNAVEQATEPRSLLPALDTLTGTLTALGELEAAQAVLERLRGLEPGPISPVPFHEATLARLSGRFDEASARYQDVVDALAEIPQASGAVAVALSSQAEVALFQQDPEQARAGYAAAAQRWAAAGRRSGLYRSEAGQLRAALLAGATPITRGLGDRIRFAEDRQLRMLEAHLRIVRAGLYHHAGQDGVPDLQRAVALAEASGARFLEGRARLGLRTVGVPVDIARLQGCLAGDAGWSAVMAGALPMPW